MRTRAAAAAGVARLAMLAALAGAALLLTAMPAAADSARMSAASDDGDADPATPPAPAQPEFDFAAHYTKHEYRIPMRDGARLFTVVYIPKDTSRRYPFLVERTPYSVGTYADDKLNYGVDFMPREVGPSREFMRAGYIFVEQDVRGRYMSEGTWTEMQPHVPEPGSVPAGQPVTNASTDMHDSIEWLLQHVPNHNGRVGIWGLSYPGFFAAASIIDSHPAIKAASPQAPVTDLYMGDDAYHGGAFMLAANYGFYTAFKPQANPTDRPRQQLDFDYDSADAYDYFLKLGTLQRMTESLDADQREYFRSQADQPDHGAYWQARNIAPHLKNIHCAVLTVGGWFDAEDLQGALKTHASIERQNPGIENRLVMGPWVHGGWIAADGARLGHASFAQKTAQYYRHNILLPFFEQHLRGELPKSVDKETAATLEAMAKRGPAKPAKATVFETGSNVWREYDAWPPKQAVARTLYFQPGGGLSVQPPSLAAAPADGGYDQYLSDPARPVPFVGYPTLQLPREYMTGDQRFAATRPDVLVYATEPLEDDVTIVGPVEPRLFVSTSGTDADWVVKLIDVYPGNYPQPPTADKPSRRGADVPPPGPAPLGGFQQLVRGEPLRGKFRNGFERPEPFVPGAVTALGFRMPDVAHTFRRGHRIMVQVQSSWFPLIDRNPQVFMRIPDAQPGDFKAATQRVYRAPGQASAVVVQVMPEVVPALH